ncbi:MAG: hypothetical protein GX312_02915, partial [Candidatus Phytoplasma sp.]|nr:hypothetical protein [Phytoplasma sp.]
GTIRNIQNYAQITGLHNDIGGIVGYNEGFITNVFNYGKITSKGSFVGGIAGQSYQHIKEAYNKASITGYVNVGGIVGNNHAPIEYAYNTGLITATKNISGGIAGISYKDISYSFNSGDIISEDSVAGGITGVLNHSTIKGTYNGGTVTAKSSQAAGIAANVENGIIKDSYHFGKVYSQHDLGIIIGNQIDDNQKVLQQVYYDQDAHINSDITQYKIPTQMIGNKEYHSNATALYHGQMIGMHALGTTKNNMNLSEKTNYLQKESEEQYSYYPQIKFFGTHTNTVVLNDSIESVKTKTFIVGTGNESNPYIIRNESDWLALADSTTNGNTYTNTFFEVSKEVAELNFMDAEENYLFKPVGTKDKPFNGKLNGNGVNIKIKTIHEKEYQALFGHLGKNAHIKALSVSGEILGKDYTAGIAALNEGVIEEVYNQAQITGKDYTAGIAALNKGEIKNVYNKGKITGNQYVGGITAHLDGTLINSYQSGIVYGQKTLGMIVGFYEKGMFSNSYYDETILNAYRNITPKIKPEGSVGSTYNGDLVKGLDNRFMTGSNALGTGNFNINFKDGKDIWSANRNIESENHYPQLLVFATNTHQTIKEASQQSTLNHLYNISFDERNNENNDTILKQVLINEHFLLYIPTYFGYNFVGWYYLDGQTEVQLTNAKGESLKPYDIYEDLEVFAKWEEAYHQVTFIDGDDQVIYETEIRHGEYAFMPVGITPSKTKDQLYIYQFESWNFDFDHTMILSPTKIYATYKTIDRYYEVIYYDGNNEIFEITKAEYETYLQPTKKIPTKTYHDDIAYQFIEWDFNFNEVIKNKVEIHPIFIKVDRYYTVEFYNENQLIYTTITEYLDQAKTPEETPIKISDEKYDYQFIGWDKNIDRITEDLKVYAEFKATLKEFIVIFKDGNDEIFETQRVKYGQSALNPFGIPTKKSQLNTAYQFIGWDQSFDEVKTDLTINALFKEVDRYYTVNFYDALENIIDTQIVEYLHAAVLPLVTPTKEKTQSHIYTFEKWDKNLESITENLEVRPIFKEELRPYQVYFIDGDNNIFNQQTVLYGEDATIPSGIPRKQGILDIGFKFISWGTNYKEITNDTYVYANFSETNRYYYVTFMDQDLVLKTEKVEYGYSATAPDLVFDEHPTKGYEYYFISWSGDFSFVETDLIIKLNKGSRLMSFKVTIVNGDEITTQTVEYGKNVTLPTPSKKGNEQIHYQFISWSHDGKNITENMTITASFEEVYNYFEVRFYDGNNTLIKLEKVAPGMSASAPTTVLKDKTENKIYLFLNWDKDFSMVESNLNVYAKFKEVDRYYEVIFYDAYGKELSIQSVEYGQSAIEPLAPEKQDEGRYEYHFTNWDKDFSEVVENMLIYPEYEEREKTFTVNFYDGNNQLISSQQVKYGLNATAPSKAEKSPTETKYYLFSRWDKNYTNITEDLEIYAEFNEVDRWYQVTFVGENQQILNQQIVEYGKSAKDPIPILGLDATTIINDHTIRVIYEWDQDFSFITENLYINAIYKDVDRYYQVTFYDEKNNILEEMRVHYGTNITPPTPPLKQGNTDYFYVFKGWSEDFSFITKNLDIYPEYEELKTKYQVIFYDALGQIFDIQEVEYGKDAIDPGNPLKEPTDEESYIFTGWDQDFKNITEDKEIYPTYSTHERTFVVIFKDDQGNILKEELVRKGGSAIPPSNIKEKPQNDYFKYIPMWDNDYTNITEDKVITLYYEEVERIYTASFYDENNLLIHTITGTYLSYIDAPEGPIKAMTDQYIYQFISWDPVFNNQLTKDISYYPVYERTIRTYVVTFLDGDNEVYDVQEIAYGQSPKKPSGTPTKQADKQYYYEFRMWETTTIKVYQDITIHAIFYRYLQKYQVTFVDEYDNILSSQTVEYGNGATEPDASKIP